MWLKGQAVLWVFSLACACASAEIPVDAAVTRTRPYTLDDYFTQEEFKSVAVAAGGRWIALERVRPAAEGESYIAPGYSAGEPLSRRSDIWILNSETGDVVWRTNGKGLRQSNFAPLWSPNGEELAFLQSSPDGRVGVAVWKTSTRKMTLVKGIDADLTVLFTRGVSAAEDAHNFFVWSDDSRLYVAGRGTMPSQPLGTAMVEGLSSRWRETWHGRASARVWNTESPVLCNQGVKLFEVSADKARVNQLFVGAITGVSLSPNALGIAIASAKPGMQTPSAEPLAPAKSRRMANRNEYGFWQVDILDRSVTPAVTRTVATGTGDMGAAVLPRWSSDARRLAIITGNETQNRGQPAVVLVDLVEGSNIRVKTSSILDAQALAGLYAAVAVESLDGRLWTTPAESVLMGDGISDRADVFALAQNRAIVVDARGVTLVGKHGPILRLSEDGSVVHIAAESKHLRIYLKAKKGLERVDVTARGARHKILNLSENRRFVGVAFGDKAITLEDTQIGSFMWSESEEGKQTMLVRANEHIASILVPESRSIKYTASGEEREGVLYLPTVRRFGHRPPVVVTAYPMTEPMTAIASQFVGQVNSSYAWHWHPMLAAGFAVYVVDFRRARSADVSPPSYVETPHLITSEVIPAIEALAQESGIDGTNLGFAGFSQGGYTALTLLGRTRVFKAIAAEVPLANLATNLSATPELRLQDCAPAFETSGFVELEAPSGFLRLGGPPYLQRSRMIDYSPLFNLEDATTPTLMLTAELDPYGPAGAEQTYMMLLRKGVPAQLVTYWGENHLISSPGNIRDMIEREIAWFKKYLAPSATEAYSRTH